MQGIAQYSLEQWGAEQQARYLAALERGLLALLDHPEIGRPRDDLSPGSRVYLIEQHVAIYDLRGATLRVLRILHGRRDIARALRRKP